MAVHEGNPMRKAALSALAACLLFASLVSQLWAQGKKQAAPAPALKVGDVAPDFKLQYFDGTDDKDVTLSQYRDKKNVVLAFYIFAFTGGWTPQIKNFPQNLQKLEAADTQDLGVSMDRPHAHKTFADQNGAKFPSFSDWGRGSYPPY